MNQIEEVAQEGAAVARPRRSAKAQRAPGRNTSLTPDAADATPVPASRAKPRRSAPKTGRSQKSKQPPSRDMPAPEPATAPEPRTRHEEPEIPAASSRDPGAAPNADRNTGEERDVGALAAVGAGDQASPGAYEKMASHLQRMHRAAEKAIDKAGALWSYINTEQEVAARQPNRDEALAPHSTPEAADPRPAPADGQRQHQDREIDVDGIVASLSNRYLIADDKYYFRDRGQALAFEDLGRRIATVHNDPDVARSMVDLAQAKGWSSLKVKGSDVFKSEVWLLAAQRGMDVSGYRPKEIDKARLAAIEAERDIARINTIERNMQLDLPLAAPAEKRVKPEVEPPETQASPNLSTRQQQAVELLKTLLRDRGDSEKAVELTAAVAAEQMLTRRSYVGRLLDHGPARYQHDQDADPSYFVVLDTPRGEKTVWGVDLKRALEEAQIERGADVLLSKVGHRDVTVPVLERTADGRPAGRCYVDTMRNDWDIQTVDSMRDLAASRAVTRDSTADSPEPSGQASRRHSVQPPLAPVPTHAHEKHIERESPER
ncbi:LPD7 domain-containing protein [Duganella hordei]|uniref:LPD7 domain-containing protein n=1 Tax=Duganella hordei TaxID=2865934 RepID=UPI0030EA8C73